MCEKWPGPRCNDKCKNRDIKKALLQQVAKVHSTESFEYKNAVAELLASQETYDTTPRGIAELTETLKTNKITSSIIPARLIKGKTTRLLQTEALKEIENNRVSSIANIISTLYPVFSQEETETIIAAARENREKAVIKNLSFNIFKTQNYSVDNINKTIEDALETSGESYYEYVEKIKNTIHQTYGFNIPEHVQQSLTVLDELMPPNKVSLHAYRSIGHALEKSKQQLNDEFHKISAIQDASPKTVAEYFDAYRQQYKEKYANLPAEQQPNPPKDWIEGDLPRNGLTKNEETFFIPRDPSTLYAIYKLRTDLNAIPDYLKQSTKIAAIDKIGNTYQVKYVSRTGKDLKTETFQTSEEAANILNKQTNDTTIIFKNKEDAADIHIKDRHRIISIPDVASKHFDIQNDSTESLTSFLKTNNNSLDIYGAMRRKILKTWSTKPVRNQTENLDFTPQMNTRSIKFVR